jgi:glycosyltransferase involved in cell wall biosynthesis
VLTLACLSMFSRPPLRRQLDILDHHWHNQTTILPNSPPAEIARTLERTAMRARRLEPIHRVWIEANVQRPPFEARALLAIVDALRSGMLPRLHLCRLDLDAGGFVELPMSILDFLRQTDQDAHETASPAQDSSPLKQRVKRLVKPFVNCLPAPVKQLIRRWRASRRKPDVSMQSIFSSYNSGLRLDARLGKKDLLICFGPGAEAPGQSALRWRLKKEHDIGVVWMIDHVLPIEFPQFFEPSCCQRFAHSLVDALWTADLIVTASESSRADIRRNCLRSGITPPAVEVIRPGTSLSTNGPEQRPEALENGEAFVLCAGPIEARCNLLLLYHVWRRIAEAGQERMPTLVIAGALGWGSGDMMDQALRDPLTKNHIRFLTTCREAERRWLFRHCLFTACPSVSDAGGQPVIDSFAFGKYCVAGDIAPIREIGADLIAYHDCYDVAACLERVTAALAPAFRHAQEERIKQHDHKWEWSDHARQIARLLSAQFGGGFLTKAALLRN